MQDWEFELDSTYHGDYSDCPVCMEDSMTKVERFEDKVKQAFKDVMKHAVAGHGSDTAFTTFCNNPDHALEILAGASIRPVNEATARLTFDKTP